MIKIQDLERHFPIPDSPPVRAVNGLTLTIKKGEFVAVMGPSGSGKSTLLYVLGAMDQATGGWVQIADRRLDQMNDVEQSQFRNTTLGFVFQSFHLLPRLSLVRNVEIPMMYARVPVEERQRRATMLLSGLGLGDKTDRAPTELSGGQCQRAAIARALVNNPQVLLADEPTGNLDTRTGQEVIAVFQALNRQGMTVIMVTHDEQMACHASRILKMRDGHLEEDLAVENPLQSPLSEEMNLDFQGGTV